MNEKINELMLEATKDMSKTYYWPGQYVEKFAELIIKECASKVDNILREKKDGGGTMGDEIREHFGVGE